MSEGQAPMTKIHSSFMATGGIFAVLGLVLSGLAVGSGGIEGLAAPWLYGAVFWSCLTFGCIGLMLLFHLTRGRWGTPMLRIFESGGGVMHVGLVAVVLFGISWFLFKDPIYGAWVHMPADDQILQNKKFYLNEPAFMVRSVLYILVLGAIAHFFRQWTLEEEKTGDKKWSDLRNNVSGIAFLSYFVLLTFLTTDYVMSIDPHWYSTIWGIWFAIGGGLAAMALAVGIVVTQMDKAPYAGKIDVMMRNDFGNLLFMMTMLWGYLSFSQLLIIWSGNLKEFIPFYLARLRGAYSNLGYGLFVGQFLVPFLCLLSPSLKKSKAMLGFVAGMILIFRMVDMYWIIFPYFRSSLQPAITDFGPFLLIGGVWLALFGFNLRTAPLLTAAHPYQDHQPLEMKEAMDNV